MVSSEFFKPRKDVTKIALIVELTLKDTIPQRKGECR